MTQYNKDVKRLIDALAMEILKEGTLSQKRLNELISKMYKGMIAPTDKFLKRLKELAYEQAISQENATVKAILASNTTANIQALTPRQLEIISLHAITKNLIFTKWKNANRKELTSDTYNMEDAIKALPAQISKDYKRRALAGMIAGNTPAEVARSLMDRNLGKKTRRNIKTLYRTSLYKAKSLANLEAMKVNEKYFDYYRFVTMDDDRVETVCMHLADESEKKKWRTMEDVPVEAYTPVHFNCRCRIESGFE